MTKENHKTRMVAALCMLVMFSGTFLMSQEDCSVLVEDLSGSYTGKCKKGLAHGKGLAQGIDSYEGKFSKGLPNGTGTYTWSDGRVYEGEWRTGQRDGVGTMTYPADGEDSIQAGYWKDDVYKGKILIPPYKITRMQGVERSSIVKTSNVGSGFSLGLYLSGKNNTGIEGFTMVSGSGTEYQSGAFYGIENASVPYSVSIRYRTWNNMHSTQRDVVFEFMINEPGTFEVSISN
jgi:hypothetical protein